MPSGCLGVLLVNLWNFSLNVQMVKYTQKKLKKNSSQHPGCVRDIYWLSFVVVSLLIIHLCLKENLFWKLLKCNKGELCWDTCWCTIAEWQTEVCEEGLVNSLSEECEHTTEFVVKEKRIVLQIWSHSESNNSVRWS